ncbi:MAG: chloride channel protein [Bacteroidetes bacterium]|nr:chloride channel protein [Bacteroidota bacterium]HET6245419.1 chloride channel protein [Bacteroidia bacterium]
MKPLLLRFLKWRNLHVSNKAFVLILSVLIGFCAGIAAVILKTLTHYIREKIVKNYEDANENYLFFALPFIGILLTVFFFKFFIKEKAGHGISSILFSISRRKGFLKRHKMYSPVIGSAFTVGFGGSVGLEASIVSAGSAIGSNIGRLFKLEYKHILLLIGCGATGAIAAIFNTPIAALVFALEVLMLDLTLASLIPLLMASITGTVTAKLFFAEELLFNFKIQDAFVSSDVPFFILLGLLCGLISVYFTRTEMFVEKKIKLIQNDYIRAVFGGIFLGLAIFLLPPLFGEGYDSISSLLSQAPGKLLEHSFVFSQRENNYILVAFLFLAILFKPFATALTIGSGGAGGIFAPSLLMGGISGFLVARVINMMNLPFTISETNFTLAGMAGLIAGILHAPLMALFLIAELSGGYQLIVPLMITSGVSLVTARFFEPHSIYTKRLAEKGQLITHHKDKAVLTLMKIKEVIENDFESVNPEDTLGELIKVIARSKRNIFPVVNKENHFLGIVMLDDIRDIMFDPEQYQTIVVDDIMSIAPAHLCITDSMENVMDVFTETGAWNLPVLEQGKYQGFISKSKMFSAYRNVLVEFSHE